MERQKSGTKETFSAVVTPKGGKAEEVDSDDDFSEALGGGDDVQLNQYTLKEVLGKGAYGVVRRAEATDDDGKTHSFAVKVLDKTSLKRQKSFRRIGRRMTVTTALDKAKRELAIMKKVAHENVVHCFEIIDDPESDHLFLVLELVSGGELARWDDKAGAFRTAEGAASAAGDWPTFQARVRQLLAGLAYLHRNRIAHRDIKPENVLLTSDGRPKLADLGVSHIFKEGEETLLRTSEGTPFFMAPEMLTGKPFEAFGTDMWAVGVTLFGCAYGSLPFFARNKLELNELILNAELVIPDDAAVPPPFRDFVARLLAKDPAARLTLADATTHPFLSTTSSPVQPPSPAALITVTEAEVDAAVTKLSKMRVLSHVTMLLSRKLLRNRRRRKRRAERRRQHNAELKARVRRSARRLSKLSGVIRTLSGRSLLEGINAARGATGATSAVPKAQVPVAAPPVPISGAGAGVGAGAGAGGAPPLPIAEFRTLESPRAQVVQRGEETVVNGYRYGKLLGKGSFGAVYEGSCNQAGVPNKVAVKVLSKQRLAKMRKFKRQGGRISVVTALDKARAELAILKVIKAKNVVRCFDIINDDDVDELYLVLELVAGGELLSFDIKSGKFTPNPLCAGLTEDACRTRFRDILKGLDYLHSNCIAHRDIKPENVLVSDTVTKLADLGCATMFASDKTTMRAGLPWGQVRDTVGTPAFLAPECLTPHAYNAFAADVWALGVTLYAMLCKRLPFVGTTKAEVLTAIQEHDLAFDASAGVSPAAQDLLRGMLRKDATTRFTVEQCKRHPWVTEQGHLKVWGLLRDKLNVDESAIEHAVTPVRHIEVVKSVHRAVTRLSRRRRRRQRQQQQKKQQQA